MPSLDREVFDHFLKNPDLTREEGLLAFASYSADKYDWIAHAEKRDGHPPSDAEIERWIRDLSDVRLKAIQDQAIAGFDVAARAYMQPIMEDAATKAVDESILGEVKRATSFRQTFLPNLFIGIVASLAFTVLVILFGLIFERDPSPIALWRKSQGITNAPASIQTAPTPGQ